MRFYRTIACALFGHKWRKNINGLARVCKRCGELRAIKRRLAKQEKEV